MSKYLFISIFTLLSVAASAQKTNVWRGGAPGHETDWAFFKNWSAGHTPNEFDHVVIPNVSTSTNKYPVIRKDDVEVLSLKIDTGASLTLLPQARLYTEDVEISGTCKGCQERHLIEGTVDATTAYSTQQ
jgi:hypothetical protein